MAAAQASPTAPAHPIRIDIVNISNEQIRAYVVGTDIDPHVVAGAGHVGPDEKNYPHTG